MQPEIPKGSLILVHHTDPLALENGDNITFMRNWRTAITHKIVDIHENYQGSGSRGFQTQGTNNTNPDREVVLEENVVGKVKLVIPHVGTVLSRLGDNIYIIYIILGASIALSLTVNYIKKKKYEGRADHNDDQDF